MRNVCVYGTIYLALTLLEWAVMGPARVMERTLAFSISKNFLDHLYHQAVHFPITWHQQNHSGATINRIRKAYEALRDFFQNGFMFLHALTKFIFSFAAILWFSPTAGLISMFIGVINIWILVKFDKPFFKTLTESNERDHAVSSNLFDSLSNINTVLTLRLEDRMKVGLIEKVDNAFPPFRKSAVINEWKWFVGSSLMALTYSVVVIEYVSENYVPNEVFLIGGLVTLLGYVNQFTGVFQEIAWQYTELVRYHAEVETARVLRSGGMSVGEASPCEGLPSGWESLQISNLNFSYTREGVRAKCVPGLKDISLSIRRGQRIALIGSSGSGKSTLLALLRGLFPAEPGAEVILDQKNVVPFAMLNDSVTLLPQDPEIFENTLHYNLTLGLPVEKEDIMHICGLLELEDVITGLPNGLDSIVQERGANLSGGQKQRIALARGILASKASNIVLLDEPTSAVDLRTEALIYDRLFAQFPDKTIISSLHRLHLLPRFDYIYILQNGYIAEEGTFDWLYNHSECFNDLWKLQKVSHV